jgi:hypothetical protein
MAWRILWSGNYSILYYSGGYEIHLLISIGYTTPTANPNYELWAMIWHYWFIHCNKCFTLVWVAGDAMCTVGKFTESSALFLRGGAVPVFELGFTLARQALYHLSHSTNPFLCWLFSR